MEATWTAPGRLATDTLMSDAPRVQALAADVRTALGVARALLGGTDGAFNLSAARDAVDRAAGLTERGCATVAAEYAAATARRAASDAAGVRLRVITHALTAACDVAATLGVAAAPSVRRALEAARADVAAAARAVDRITAGAGGDERAVADLARSRLDGARETVDAATTAVQTERAAAAALEASREGSCCVGAAPPCGLMWLHSGLGTAD